MRITHLSWLVLAWLLVVASPARAFTTLAGEAAGTAAWSGISVPVFLDVAVSPDVSLPDVEAALIASITTWNTPDCSYLRLEYAGLVAGAPKLGVYIHWADPAMVGEVVGPDAAAVTETWVTADGEIFRSDMHLNPLFAWSTSDEASFPETNDVEAVITHELGHAFGLAHTRERLATMYFAGGDNTLRTLEDDDVRAVCYQYPAVPFVDGRSCDQCAAHANCGDGRCLAFPEGGDYCAGPCKADADCPGGFTCTDVPTGGKLCLPNNLYCHEGGGTIPLGEYCYGHATCASGVCLPTRLSAQCTDVCAGSDGCPATMSCVPMGGACGGPCSLCLKTGTGKVGDLCADGAGCASAVCVGDGNVGVCSAFCDPGGAPCPDGATCAGGYCTVPGTLPIGAPCDTGFDCVGMFCVDLGDGARCTASCDTGGPCAGNAVCVGFDLARPCAASADCGGLDCVDVGSGVKLCGCEGDADCQAGESCGRSGVTGPKVCQLELCQLRLQGADEGELCDDSHACATGLLCDRASDTWGACRAPCTPAGDPCPDGFACAWTAGSDPPAGTCNPAASVTAGAPCDGQTPCAPGLACAKVGAAAACAPDCVVGGACAEGACVALSADGWPQRGACLATGTTGASLVVPDPPAEPQLPGPDAGPGGGGSIVGDRYVAIDRVPSSGGGCRAAPARDTTWALALLVALGLVRRRRRALG